MTTSIEQHNLFIVNHLYNSAVYANIAIYVIHEALYLEPFSLGDILSISPILQNQNRNSVRSAKIQFHNQLFRDGDVMHFSLTSFQI
jgi:hypothetical protein